MDQNQMNISVVNSLDGLKRALGQEDLRYFPETVDDRQDTELGRGWVLRKTRRLTDTGPQDFTELGRGPGWVTALMVTDKGRVVILAQSKKGTEWPVVEFPAGGIPESTAGMDEETIIASAAREAERESGYGEHREAMYLGSGVVESGQMFNLGCVPEHYRPGAGRGVLAHMVLLRKVSYLYPPQPRPSERYAVMLITPTTLRELVLDPSLPMEISAKMAATTALLRGLI